ncbi:FixH family protein [Bacillus marinisedimentorum]|uniref:FixH family protein n=1 Tax=Bacillus marinisedimentorum TaxID=1821260 RepID=UPI000871D2B1|nr:FixH family protein [Bacillus marinisedimentorum]
MKKLMIALLALIMLTACGAETSLQADVKETSGYVQGEATEIVLAINDEKGPAEGLDVSGVLEMAKMDHGTIEVEFKEQSAGTYASSVELPMGGEWQADLTLENDGEQAEQLVTFEVAEAGKKAGTASADQTGAIATVNGFEITQEDLAFYELINKIQIEMYKESDEKKYEGEELEQALAYWDAQEQATTDRNTLLSQIIRLRAASLLAEEKGHTASNDEIAAELQKARQQYSASPAAMALVKEYGEEAFWNKQKSQYGMIVLTQKVQKDMIDRVKEENPESDTKEVNVLAQKKYEELLVSQMGTLDINLQP